MRTICPEFKIPQGIEIEERILNFPDVYRDEDTNFIRTRVFEKYFYFTKFLNKSPVTDENTKVYQIVLTLLPQNPKVD